MDRFHTEGILQVIYISESFKLQVFFLSCVVVAGIYGAYSVSKKILWVQAMPAVVGLVFIFLN